MASLFKIKRSETSGNPAVLGSGELAYSGLPASGSNGGDRLYIGMGTETAGNAANHVVIGGKYFTDQITAATSEKTANTLVRRDPLGGFAAEFVIADLIGNASTATSWVTPRELSLIGDAAATFSGVDGSSNAYGVLTLATVNSSVGVFGSTTEIPVITVNDKGLVTSVTIAAISAVPGSGGTANTGTLLIAGSSGTGSIALDTEILRIEGGTGVTSVYNNNTKTTTLSIGQAVGTTDSVTFNNVLINGTLNSADIITDNITVSGDATITGNLTVQGTTTTINSTAIAVSDVNITLAKDATTAAAAEGAGLTVVGPTIPATFTYTSIDDRWNLNKNLNVANVYGALVGNADTSTKLTTARAISATGDATWTTSFDGSAPVSGVLTLASVNSNVGDFGNATSVPTVTVNAKGLVTAVTTTAIPTASTSINGLARFDSTEFAVDAGLVTIAVTDGGTY